MNTPSSNAPKNHSFSESLEADQLAVSLKDMKSINPSREGDMYGRCVRFISNLCG